MPSEEQATVTIEVPVAYGIEVELHRRHDPLSDEQDVPQGDDRPSTLYVKFISTDANKASALSALASFGSQFQAAVGEEGD